jgi:hypothetical protein
MMFARSLRVLLAAALLVAWQNALVHPIEHVDEAGGFVHLSGGHDGGQRNGNAADPLCDAVAAAAACVASTAGLVFAVPQGIESLSARQADSFRHAPLLAYRSQAPPRHS